MQLEARQISYQYMNGAPILQNIDFKVQTGECVGLTGPSGYGKSTLAKLLAGYMTPHSGQILLDSAPLPKSSFHPVQLIYQHPEKAVNPRWKMKKILEEAGPIDTSICSAIGIEKGWLHRYPQELSGGELQRFCVARAFQPATRFLIADEISTMLDVITQAQLWKFILEEAKKRGLGIVVVTHNMSLAQKICTRIVELPQINHLL